jgi:hypothetical protein
LSNKEIGEATGFSHQPALLSDYLKRLQNVGLITRNIVDRRYYLKEMSTEILFFNDIARLVQSQVDKTVYEKKEHNVFGFGYGLYTVENNSEFLEQLGNAFAKPENLELLRKVERIVEGEWNDFILASKAFNEVEREIIRQHFKMTNELREITRSQIEAKDKENSGTANEFKLVLSEPEKKRYDEIMLFLNYAKNKNIMEKWYYKTMGSPKTLVVFAPLGFYEEPYEIKIEGLLNEH